jgi:hypothetical protein
VVATAEGVTAVWVTVATLVSECCVAAVVMGVIAVCVTDGMKASECCVVVVAEVVAADERHRTCGRFNNVVVDIPRGRRRRWRRCTCHGVGIDSGEWATSVCASACLIVCVVSVVAIAHMIAACERRRAGCRTIGFGVVDVP